LVNSELDENEEIDKDEILRALLSKFFLAKLLSKDHLLKLTKQFQKHISQNQELRTK